MRSHSDETRSFLLNVETDYEGEMCDSSLVFITSPTNDHNIKIQHLKADNYHRSAICSFNVTTSWTLFTYFR